MGESIRYVKVIYVEFVDVLVDYFLGFTID